MHRIVTVDMVSTAPYSQSKPILTERKPREKHGEYEERVWRERAHVDRDGICFIPPTSLKNCISEAASFTPRTGPTGGKSTYTKNIVAAVMCLSPISLKVHKDNIVGETLFVPSDGKRGGGSRVWKTFPLFDEWSGTAEFMVFDESIDQKIMELYIREMGIYIGLGRFRPRNNGFYGRFRVKEFSWRAIEDE